MWKWFQYDTLLEILALMSFDGPNQILSIFHHLVSFDGPKNLISFDGHTFFSPPKPHVFWRTQKPHVFGWTLDLLPFGGPKVPIIFIITFFFLFQRFAQRVQTQITELLTQSVTILNLLRLLIMMHRLPALQNLEQLNMEENWQNRVHQ